MQSSEKMFEKIIGRLYKANTCLSNLIFLPLIFPNFYENICFSFPVFFSRTQAESMLLWTGRPCKQDRRGVFGDGRPSIVLETPKPEFRDGKL